VKGMATGILKEANPVSQIKGIFGKKKQ